MEQGGHRLAAQLAADGQAVAVGIGQGNLGMGHPLLVPVVLQNGDIAHGITGDRDQRHLVVHRVQRRQKDHVRLIVAAVGLGLTELFVSVHTHQQQVHHAILIAVVLPVPIHGIAVQLGIVALVNGGSLDGPAAQDAAAVEPDAEYRGAQQQRHRHQNDEQQQRQRQLFVFFLFFHRPLTFAGRCTAPSAHPAPDSAACGSAYSRWTGSAPYLQTPETAPGDSSH